MQKPRVFWFFIAVFAFVFRVARWVVFVLSLWMVDITDMTLVFHRTGCARHETFASSKGTLRRWGSATRCQMAYLSENSTSHGSALMGVVYDGVPSKHVPVFLGEGIEGRDAADGSTTNDLCDFMVPIWCVYSWPLSWTLSWTSFWLPPAKVGTLLLSKKRSVQVSAAMQAKRIQTKNLKIRQSNN